MNTQVTQPSIEALDKCAERLKVTTDYLINWANQTGLMTHHFDQLLYMANCYDLDPLIEEIMWAENANHGGKPFITIDGWMKILNAQSHFCGLQFREASSPFNDIPAWMECTIYRDDRVLPIVVKEYFEEIKTEHHSWITHPRRMLRHRALQQAIRLAFGISSPDITRTPAWISPTSTEPKQTARGAPQSRTSLLKEHLQSTSTIA